MNRPRLVRLTATAGRPLVFRLDGRELRGIEGDTVLTAVLTQAECLRISEFGDGPRAGFCLMGACQDCWIWTEDGQRMRACTTRLASGMALRTTPPEETVWPARG